jgi:hypothetical protein
MGILWNLFMVGCTGCFGCCVLSFVCWHGCVGYGAGAWCWAWAKKKEKFKYAEVGLCICICHLYVYLDISNNNGIISHISPLKNTSTFVILQASHLPRPLPEVARTNRRVILGIDHQKCLTKIKNPVHFSEITLPHPRPSFSPFIAQSLASSPTFLHFSLEFKESSL